jgi:hypothetical protein
MRQLDGDEAARGRALALCEPDAGHAACTEFAQQPVRPQLGRHRLRSAARHGNAGEPAARVLGV